MLTREATVLIVPGLRDHVPEHWQTLLASRLPRVRCVAPMGRDNLDCAARVEAIERQAASIDGPIILVAHSRRRYSDRALGAADQAQRQGRIAGDAAGLRAAVARMDIPRWKRCGRAAGFSRRAGRSHFQASSPRAATIRSRASSSVAAMARQWGSRLVDLGEVGHLNPASGYGDWPAADALIAELEAETEYCWLKARQFS